VSGVDHERDPGRVSQIEHGEVSTVGALASYLAALGGKLELVADIGGHLLKMPANPGVRDIRRSGVKKPGNVWGWLVAQK
jgi:hypothetical protein